jgi:hypothetical protein
MIRSKCADDDHRYEILDVITVVGWDENDIAIPCRLETWQCVECGELQESVEEDRETVDNENDFDILSE